METRGFIPHPFMFVSHASLQFYKDIGMAYAASCFSIPISHHLYFGKKVLSIQNTCNRLHMRKLCRKSGRGTIDGNVHCKINDHLAIMHMYL